MKLSKTNQRRVILEELRKLTSHPTADELYEIVRIRLPQISLGTVYRNLEQLSIAGIIKKLELSGKQKRFDGNINLHYHMRCKKCHCVVDVEHAKLMDLEFILNNLISDLDFQGYHLELLGLCKNCRTHKA